MAGRYTLYGWKLTGSCAIEAALAEAGVDYDFVPVSRKTDENRGEAFARINPRRQLPALTLPDGSHMAEGAAILLHIADAFPDKKLAPPPGSFERAHHDRWLLFFAANVYEGELRKLRPERYTIEPQGTEGIKAAAVQYVCDHYLLYERQLGHGPYLFGNWLTMIDIYVWMLAQWMPQVWLAENCPKIDRLSRTVAERPAIAPVHAAHFLTG